MGRRDAQRERERKSHTRLNVHSQFQTQDLFTVKQKLFYTTPQPSAKHIIQFPSFQCNIFKMVCSRPAKNVTRLFYLAAPSPHEFFSYSLITAEFSCQECINTSGLTGFSWIHKSLVL
jgi:hypothetical protein